MKITISIWDDVTSTTTSVSRDLPIMTSDALEVGIAAVRLALVAAGHHPSNVFETQEQ